jgi:hypothetical protein
MRETVYSGEGQGCQESSVADSHSFFADPDHNGKQNARTRDLSDIYL